MSLKGKAVIAQSGGCTAVINQSLAGAAEEAKTAKLISGVWGSRFGIEGILNRDFVDLKRQPSALLRRIAGQPSSALGSSRYKLKPGEEFRVLDQLKKEGVRYFFMIGGNDTAETCLRISKAARESRYDLRTAHIPKTIDNDLMETDHCPGYGSVARFAAITTQEAGLDTKAMRRVDPVKIIELMGRNSGWIAAASALLKEKASDPPHLLWLPEVPFEPAVFLSRVEAVLKNAGYCVVVISETIRDSSGKRVGERQEGITQDPFGHPYVEGASGVLARLVENEFKIRARFDKPGTIQRMSIPYVSEIDQKEAREAGRRAVRWVLQGKSEFMVAFRRLSGRTYRITYVPVPLEKIPGRERYLPKSFLSPDGGAVTPAFRRYALPLLGRSLPAFPDFHP